MRLWTLHPKYLDPRGLVTLWREGLLAQAVLKDQTKGYKHHPQLTRFRHQNDPISAISSYLHIVYNESIDRGYHFNREKIFQEHHADPIPVTNEQIKFEWAHLKRKLQLRNPQWLTKFTMDYQPETHPLFYVITGKIENWEKGAIRLISIVK